MAPQLAWIGLGNMGSGMVKNLVEKGELSEPLIIFNRTTSRAEDLHKKIGGNKTKVAASIEEAVAPADIIFTCLGDDASVEENYEKIFKAGPSGKLLVDCSTIHPDTTAKLADAVKAQGAHLVASPVFGAPAMAESGMLVFVLAGPAADIERIRPYTKGVMGRENIEFGDQEAKQASLMKIVGNTFILQMVEALGEGHTVAEKSGLGTENVHKFLTLMMPAPYAAYSTRMTSGDYFNRDRPLFHVDLALKDVRHALEIAERSGSKMRSVEVAQQHLKEVKSAKGDKGDLAGIYGAVRQESGLKYENS